MTREFGTELPALDVGFGSLWQFNHTFARYAGESPTKYRRRLLKGAAA